MPYGRRKTYRKSRRYAQKSTRRAPKRTRTYRRKVYRKTSALRAKWMDPLAPKQLIKFVYCDTAFSRTLNVAGSYVSYYTFRGNSPYDPDYTGVGVQPYGFDQLVSSTMYTNFRVAASSIRVYFRPESTYANMRRLHAIIFPMTVVNPVVLDISDVRMIQFHKETTYDGVTESTKGCKMKHYMSTQKLISIYTAKDASFQGTYASNPTLQWYWHVLFYADEFTDEEVDIYFDVKLKYYSALTRFDVPQES